MRIVSCLLMFLCFVHCKQQSKETVSRKKVTKTIIAHRGASGYLPEHTLASKAMAYAMKPDFIEQDLVLSKDDVPVVIHDIILDDVTDVATKFPNRKREDGRFYVIDFTFAELKQLQVTERFHPKTGEQFYKNRFPKNTSSFRLHSLQDEIELIQGLNKSTQNDIGIYPEIKNPGFHKEHGKDIAKIVLQILSEYGYHSKSDHCILQCFDAKELKRIREELNSNLFLVQLIDAPEEINLLEAYATYADGIGPWYKHLLSEKVNEQFTFTNMVAKAHALGLVVHPYTFRKDQLAEFDSFKEMVEVILFQGNADGGFTDFPDEMAEIVSKY